MFTEQDLQHLLAKYIEYTKRQKPTITVESLPQTNLNDVINHLNGIIQKQSLMVEQIASETVAIIKVFWEIYRENLTRFDEFNTEVDHKSIENEQLRDKLASIDKEKQILIIHEKLLQQQLQGLRVSMVDMHQSLIKQNQQIKQKLEDEQTFVDKSIEVLQNLKDQTIIGNQIVLSYQQKIQLETKLHELQNQLKHREQQIIKSERKLNWEQKQKQQLQLTIKQKNLIIEQLNNEIQELKETLKQNYGHIQANLQLFQPPQEFQQEEPNKQMLKLSEDVEHKQFQRKLSYANQLQNQNAKIQDNINFSNQLNIPQAISPLLTNLSRSQSQIAQSIAPTTKSLSRSQSKHKKIINLDPYYCHFVLLSQTVKITENSQNYFNIDIKPYYKEIITQKIPMHEWKEWIINKFQSLAQEKQNSSSQKSNSFNRQVKITKNKSKQLQRESRGLELQTLAK